MDNFPKIWMEDICNELNAAGFQMPDYKGGGSFDINKVENSIDLMKSYVTYSSNIYDHLNAKGLINRGYCPITGEQIGTSHLYQIFGRKVYISEDGERIAKEWDRKEHLKLFGKEPMSQEQKIEVYENLKMQKPKVPLVFWLLLVVGIIYVIKKCS